MRFVLHLTTLLLYDLLIIYLFIYSLLLQKPRLLRLALVASIGTEVVYLAYWVDSRPSGFAR